MSERAFLGDEARRRAAAAVKAVEAQTSAELVVALRRRCSGYRNGCTLFGLLCSLASFLYMYFSPRVFRVEWLLLEVLLVFGVGFGLACAITPLRRVLSLPSQRRALVATSARAAFYDLGVSRTTGRNGILVFVALLERMVEVLPDVKVDPTALGEGWSGPVAQMQTALARQDVEGLFVAIEALGPALGRAMPRQADDVNELPDEPR